MERKKSWLFGFGLIVAVVAILYQKTADNYKYEYAKQELLASVGEAGFNLFSQYDLDGDGYLSLNEFIPVTHRLIDVKVPHEYEFLFDPQDEAVVIGASFVPLDIKSMKKSLDGIEDMETMSYFTGLREWKTPAKNLMVYAAKHFTPFLPTDPDLLNSVGKAYTLWGSNSFQYITGMTPNNNRYFPPLFTDKQAIFHSLLSMFHPRPFLHSRFEPQGAVACIRAYNSDFVDVVFRIHAEFQLNEKPNLPFWFTPAYFYGNLIISRNSTTILYFHLAVPTFRKLNVDMEWLTDKADENNMEVNIGFLPKMVLESFSRSTLQADKIDLELPEDSSVAEMPPVSWIVEISMEDALNILEAKMFPFKEVPYYNFTTAFERAYNEQKLVHSVILWGVLDDQSC